MDSYSYGKLVACPYNPSHVVSNLRIQKHIINCQKQHPNIRLVPCPFNCTHLVKEDGFEQHLETCDDKLRLEGAMYNDVFQTSSSRNAYTDCASVITGQSEPMEFQSVSERGVNIPVRGNALMKRGPSGNSCRSSVSQRSQWYKEEETHLQFYDKVAQNQPPLVPLRLPTTVSKAQLLTQENDNLSKQFNDALVVSQELNTPFNSSQVSSATHNAPNAEVTDHDFQIYDSFLANPTSDLTTNFGYPFSTSKAFGFDYTADYPKVIGRGNKCSLKKKGSKKNVKKFLPDVSDMNDLVPARKTDSSYTIVVKKKTDGEVSNNEELLYETSDEEDNVFLKSIKKCEKISEQLQAINKYRKVEEQPVVQKSGAAERLLSNGRATMLLQYANSKPSRPRGRGSGVWMS